jgi:hypothetical protein
MQVHFFRFVGRLVANGRTKVWISNVGEMSSRVYLGRNATRCSRTGSLAKFLP